MIAEEKLINVGKRYELLERIGAGGMGAVYRATDRLTGHDVALKHVTTTPQELMFASRAGATDLHIALAQEFRTLASLRHPNIVGVLDYGFDRSRQPYFSMELLENPQTIIEAGQGQQTDVQIDLIVQLLQALAYLHRRGILHRDLKPGNVLVEDGRVKVLDFGLSLIAAGSVAAVSDTTAGTFAYMAPEVLQGQPVSRGADLYAVGMMFYEMLAGNYPFDTNILGVLLTNILTMPVDLADLNLNEEMVRVIERLLAKTREDRYRNANAVIRDLCAAADRPLPPETAEIRESYLQAAKFVGREEEMAQLSCELQATLDGHSSAWLVSGESGVGKSRLVDELRTLALVKGALVLRGQAVSEGGSPYHLWRNVLRRLALYTDLQAEEASVLKPHVPDIERLVGRPVQDPPLILDPREAQTRLIDAIRNVLDRQTRPLVILLEDLQWARSESLALLDRLTSKVTGWQLLMIGNFRNDECPDLPQLLACMTVLDLKRLTEQGIADLSASVLGNVGRDHQVIDLLERETEGNPFFLVEVVRSLAETFGQLDRIDVEHLPVSVYAGGVQAIVERRLERVPADDYPLLQLAAVAGRDLDLQVLRALDTKDIDAWLVAVSDAAVVDVQGDQWRFAHDKLREQVLADLPGEICPDLHQKVAHAIENVYPDDPSQAEALARHWAVAGDSNRELHYSGIAGQQAFLNNALSEAVDFLNRAIELLMLQLETTERDAQELSLQMTLGVSFTSLKGWGATETNDACQRAQLLCTKLGFTHLSDLPLFGRWAYHFARAQYDISIGLATQFFDIAPQTDQPTFAKIVGYNAQAADYCMMGLFEKSLYHAEEAIAQYTPEFHTPFVSRYGIDLAAGPARVWAALNHLLLGYPDQGGDRMQEALDFTKQFQHPHTTAFTKGYEMFFYGYQCKTGSVKPLAKEEFLFANENRFRDWICFSLIFQGWAGVALGEVEESLSLLESGMVLEEELGLVAFMPRDLTIYAQALASSRQFQQALRAINKALKITEETGTGHYEAESHRIKGEILHQLGADEDEVEEQYNKAIEVARRQKAKWWELRAIVSLARLWQSQGKTTQARQMLEEIYNWFTEGFDTVDLIEARQLLEELSDDIPIYH